MGAYEAIDEIASNKGLSLRALSIAAGRDASYISANRSRGSEFTAPVLSEILSACDYVLCAVPKEDMPPNVVTITYDGND